jgi:hypothetical protein
MEVADSGALDGSNSVVLNYIYMVEGETGYCYLHFYSESDVREYGSLQELEARLFAQFLWFAHLGTLLVHQTSEGFEQFSEHAIETLVLRSSRRMTRTPNCNEFEYFPMDSRTSLRN